MKEKTSEMRAILTKSRNISLTEFLRAVCNLSSQGLRDHLEALRASKMASKVLSVALLPFTFTFG